MRVRTIALRALLVSIMVGSLLGILAILGSSMGKTGFKILATSFSISGASALVLASLAAWQLPAARLWSRVGAWGTLAGLTLLNVGMWIEVDKDSYWKLVFTIIVFGAAGAHESLFALARLPPRYQGLRVAGMTNLVLLACAVCATVWAEHDSDGYLKLLAILAILDVTFTLAVGALDYANRSTATEGGVAEICYCPRCGRRLWYPAGEIRCGHCKAAFFIELRPSEELPTAVAHAPS